MQRKFFSAALTLAIALPSLSYAETQSADALVDHMIKARETVGFRGQVQATSQGSRSGKGALNLRLRIRGRQDQATTQLLYQVISPKISKGEALVINLSPTNGLSGFHFAPPDVVSPLPRELRVVPFFNTRLSLEEIVEDFWYWPRKLGGHESLLKHDCQIVEFHPSARNATSFSVVKVWIASDINLPLRIQKFYPNAKKIVTIDSRKIIRQGNHWVTSEFGVKTSDGRPETLFSFLNGELDIPVPSGNFTAEGLENQLKDQVEPAGQRP